jgi:hypothetical protein
VVRVRRLPAATGLQRSQGADLRIAHGDLHECRARGRVGHILGHKRVGHIGVPATLTATLRAADPPAVRAATLTGPGTATVFAPAHTPAGAARAVWGPLDDARFDALADALYDLDGSDPAIEDIDLTASLADRRAVVSMTVDADDPAQAGTKAFCTIRAAIHAIGDATVGWHGETARSVMRIGPAGRQAAGPARVRPAAMAALASS